MREKCEMRSLRKKKNKVYTDGISSEDEDDPMQTFDPEEKIKSKDFPPYFISEYLGEEVTFELFQRTGFNNPIFVKEKTGLDIRVPESSFSVTDVRNYVGGKRLLEVMNCATQLNAEMTLKDFEEFFQDPDRDDTKLNVISLEFSHTKLDGHVTAPKIVRQIDFTDNAWPRHLKDLQDDSTNDMNKMQYPKIQKYCLMSIEGCYTDFHVDLGGTSVWYHLLRGQKIFWLIPPTQANLKAFENWTLSGKQGEVFFGDMVEKCGRVILNPGNTFFIPSGWIHAVYTPVDSLVFGGNYLHPFAMERQIRIAQVEETLKVPQKFRFPFFNEMLWSILDRYCYALLGRHHLNLDNMTIQRLLGTEEERKNYQEKIGHPHITQSEVRGLRAAVLYLHSQPSTKKNVPSFIKDPVSLIKDIRIIVEVHKNDRPDRAINGRPLINWPNVRRDAHLFTKLKRIKKKEGFEPAKRNENTKCLDHSLLCSYCKLDGWFVQPSLENIIRMDSTNSLMECEECHEIVHAICIPDFGINCEHRKDGPPNTWKCFDCIKFPKPDPAQEEVPSKVARMDEDNIDMKHEMDSSSVKIKEETNDVQNDDYLINNVKNDDTIASAEIKQEPMKEDDVEMTNLTANSKSANSTELGSDIKDGTADVKQESVETFSKAERIKLHVNEYLARHNDKYGKFKVYYGMEKEERDSAIMMDQVILINVFQNLNSKDLCKIRVVCKAWNRASRHKCLASVIDLTGLKISANMITMAVNVKPETIILDNTNVRNQQLSWMLPKIPSLRNISLAGLEFGSQVCVLSSVSTPLLTELNLSSVSALTDASINKMLVLQDGKKSALANLRRLYLNNTDISDIALRYISQHLQYLSHLSLANCIKITNAGLAQVGDPSLYPSHSLTRLTLTGCKNITDSGLIHISRCNILSRIDCLNSGFSQNAIKMFLSIRTDLKSHNFVICPK